MSDDKRHRGALRTQSGRLARVIALLAISTAIVAQDAAANHQDRYTDTNRDGFLAPPDPILDSDGDGVDNFNDACPYDPSPSFYDPTTPTPPGMCGALDDKDGDHYNANQDPCDFSPDNAACDFDGDGEPNVYDDCPNLATVHMLGRDTYPGLPIRTCGPPLNSIEAYLQAWAFNSRADLGTDLALKVPPQVASKHRNLKALPINVTCSAPCQAQVGLTLRSGEIGAEGFAALPAGPGTVRLKFNQLSRAEFAKTGQLKGVVTLTAASSGFIPSVASADARELTITSDGAVLAGTPRVGARLKASPPIAGDSYDLNPEDAIPAAAKFAGIANEVAAARKCTKPSIDQITPFGSFTGPRQEVASFKFGGPDRCSVPEQLAIYARSVYDAAQSGLPVRVSYAVREEARPYRTQICHQFYGVNGIWVAHLQVDPPVKSKEGCL